MTEQKWKAVGGSKSSSIDNKTRKKVKAKSPKTENLIFIGSEEHYDSFWLKMMFISAAYAMTKKIRPAHKQTIAYVDEGYTKLEKLTLDFLRDTQKFEILKISSSADIATYLNRDRENYKLQDVAFFSHGVVGSIMMNYPSDGVDFDKDTLNSIKKDAFVTDGRLYSYACRTGVSVDSASFVNDAAAKPEQSLAQKIADHFGIEVHAFLKRSYYGDVLRVKSQSKAIAETLSKARKDKDGEVIQIPPEHEALPHPGLADSWNPWSGPKREGTNDFALWHKGGGLVLPIAADTPAGLSADMRVFKKPQPKPAKSPK